jgi:hypothetical protein
MERRAEKIIASSVETRQGFLGRPVLFVLIVSCVRSQLLRSRFLMRAYLGTPKRRDCGAERSARLSS